MQSEKGIGEGILVFWYTSIVQHSFFALDHFVLALFFFYSLRISTNKRLLCADRYVHFAFVIQQRFLTKN